MWIISLGLNNNLNRIESKNSGWDIEDPYKLNNNLNRIERVKKIYYGGYRGLRLNNNLNRIERYCIPFISRVSFCD